MEQSGVMHPSLAYMTLGVTEHVVAAILIGGGPIALFIRPTGFVSDETRTHNPRIMRPTKKGGKKRHDYCEKVTYLHIHYTHRFA